MHILTVWRRDQEEKWKESMRKVLWLGIIKMVTLLTHKEMKLLDLSSNLKTLMT